MKERFAEKHFTSSSLIVIYEFNIQIWNKEVASWMLGRINSHKYLTKLCFCVWSVYEVRLIQQQKLKDTQKYFTETTQIFLSVKKSNKIR